MSNLIDGIYALNIYQDDYDQPWRVAAYPLYEDEEGRTQDTVRTLAAFDLDIPAGEDVRDMVANRDDSDDETVDMWLDWWVDSDNPDIQPWVLDQVRDAVKNRIGYSSGYAVDKTPMMQ